MSEQLHRFGRNAHLCGILNMAPADIRRDARPAVIFITAGLLHRTGPFRLHVELSRTLAAMRVPALRFDLSGIGESGYAHDGTSAEQSAVVDVRDAMDSLSEELGVRRFILAGLCSGAEVAHRTAVADARVCGVIAMDGYILRTPAYYWRHYLPRIFSLRKWFDFIARRLSRLRSGQQETGAAPEDEALEFWGGPGPGREQLVADFDALCRRQVRQLQVFSGGSGDCSYERQFLDAFRGVDFGELLELRFLPETDHVYVLQADRRRLVRIITRWIDAHFAENAVTETASPAGAAHAPGEPVFMQHLAAGVRHVPSSSSPYTGRRNIE